MSAQPTRVVEELSASDCWALLRNAPIGRLALPGDNGIEIFPVNFIVDGGSIVFRSGVGTKLRLIGNGSLCSFEADEIDVVDLVVWSVVAKGAVRPVIAQDDMVATFDMEVPTWQAGPKPVYLRITPSSVSGRRFEVASPDPPPNVTSTS